MVWIPTAKAVEFDSLVMDSSGHSLHVNLANGLANGVVGKGFVNPLWKDFSKE